MNYLQQEEEQRKITKQHLDRLRVLGLQGIERPDLGESLNFKEIAMVFRRTLQLFGAIDTADLADLPKGAIDLIRTQASYAVSDCEEILRFSIEDHQGDILGGRGRLVKRISDRHEEHFKQLAPLITYLLVNGTNMSRVQKDLQAKTKDLVKEAEGLTTSIDQKVREAEQLVEELRNIAKEAGVSQHAIHFKIEATNNEESSEKWLRATITLASVTLMVAVGLTWQNLNSYLNPSNQYIAWQLALSKAVLVSIMLSITYWSGKTYRALRHNFVVNKHRQNALATFNTFVGSTSDDQTKNAILLQATSCIFGPQPSGYVANDVEGASQAQIIEIARMTGPRS